MLISKLLVLIGLSLNTIGAFIMLSPHLDISKKLQDDLVVKVDKNTGEYTQVKHIKNKKLSIATSACFFFGFVLQIISLFF
ncbi:MAG: hypothetical protein PHO23_01405 [Candidatus Pacebacteria bacterium]|nr:hypothetical protein [Candidatus Paceibacterota bacterium]